MSPALGFFGWIIVGGLAGWIGSKIMKTDEQMGLFLNIVVGVVGGLLGGWVLGFITCLIGACLLLWIVGLVTKKK